MKRGKRCPSGKRIYPTEQDADTTLAAIWSRPWPGRRLESRHYQCEHEIPGLYEPHYHLTSQSSGRKS